MTYNAPAQYRLTTLWRLPLNYFWESPGYPFFVCQLTTNSRSSFAHDMRGRDVLVARGHYLVQHVVECNCANGRLDTGQSPEHELYPTKSAKIHGCWYELWTPYSAIASSRMWSSAWAVQKAAYRLPNPTIFRVQKESYEILLSVRDHQ